MSDRQAFGGGDGRSSTTAYDISTPAHVRELAELVASGVSCRDMFFRLSADIDMGGAAMTPIGSYESAFDRREFSGTFIGGDHAIYNFTCDGGSGAGGLFACLDGAYIRGLRLGGFTVTGGGCVGALAGVAVGSRIQACHAGGVVAMRGGSSVGGLVGSAAACMIEESSSGSRITASSCADAGGLVGRASKNTVITSCRSLRDITAASVDHVGGFVGHLSESEVARSHTETDLACVNCANVGGFVGAADASKLAACASAAEVASRGDGMVACVGGFIGTGGAVMTSCGAAGSVLSTWQEARVGGFAGSMFGAEASASCATGDVSASGQVGGFVGYMNCPDLARTRTDDCYATGDVKVRGVEQDSVAAGFVGRVDRDSGSVVIARCYSYGAIYGSERGFLGSNVLATVTKCFWRKDVRVNEGKSASADIQALTTEQFGEQRYFDDAGWSFDGSPSVWCWSGAIAPPRPHLDGVPSLRRRQPKP